MTERAYRQLVTRAVEATERARRAERWANPLAWATWLTSSVLTVVAAVRGGSLLLAGSTSAVATVGAAAVLVAAAVIAVRACRVVAAHAADAAVGLSGSEQQAVEAQCDILASLFGLRPTSDPQLDDFTGVGVHVYDAAGRTTRVLLDLSDGAVGVRYLPYKTVAQALAA